MSNLIRIAEHVLNRPLLVHPDKVPLILSVLSGRIAIDSDAIADLRASAEGRIDGLPEDAQLILRGPAPDASRFVGANRDVDPTTGQAVGLPYRRTPEGVAVISILGGLANRGTSLEGGSMSRQSYEGIKFQIAHAGKDAKTRAVLLDLQSPGGEAIGAFECADAVRALAAVKPVVAVVNGMAASAAYAIASAATKIVTTPTGLSGSIGVVMMHADFSRALDREGVTPTMIFAGAHKVDGNPFEPLSAAVQQGLQAEVDQFYEMFIATVGNGRKGMSAKAIRGTEARTFMGQEAVRLGLADEVGSFETALSELTRGLSGRSTPAKRSTQMSGSNEPSATAGAFTQADLDRARAEGVTEGTSAGTLAGAAAERTRISGILSSDEAKGREASATHLALSTDLSADAAKGVLSGIAAAPKTEAPKPAGRGPLGISTIDPVGAKTTAPIDSAAIYGNRKAAGR
jgi:signal peptide peptidase SppA